AICHAAILRASERSAQSQQFDVPREEGLHFQPECTVRSGCHRRNSCPGTSAVWRLPVPSATGTVKDRSECSSDRPSRYGSSLSCYARSAIGLCTGWRSCHVKVLLVRSCALAPAFWGNRRDSVSCR